MLYRVQVLMSTYNGEKYIRPQLDSLKEQESVNVSLLVRDDSSCDNTLEILKEFKKESAIDVAIYDGENLGPAKSFWELIELAGGNDYYAFCDQDDKWLPEKLRVAISEIVSNEQKGAVPCVYYSNTRPVGSNLEYIDNPYKKHQHTEKFEHTLVTTACPGCGMVFNNALLLKLKEYRPARLYMHDSWTLQVCAALNGRVIYDSNEYILYRQHSNNTVGFDVSTSKMAILKRRLKKLVNFEMKPSVVAEEILKGYASQLDDERIERLKLLINASRREDGEKALWKSRLRLLGEKAFFTEHKRCNLKFVLQVLMGEI